MLQSDPEGYSQRQFEIAVMDPDEQQTEYANCVVDSIKVTVRAHIRVSVIGSAPVDGSLRL